MKFRIVSLAVFFATEIQHLQYFQRLSAQEYESLRAAFFGASPICSSSHAAEVLRRLGVHTSETEVRDVTQQLTTYREGAIMPLRCIERVAMALKRRCTVRCAMGGGDEIDAAWQAFELMQPDERGFVPQETISAVLTPFSLTAGELFTKPAIPDEAVAPAAVATPATHVLRRNPSAAVGHAKEESGWCFDDFRRCLETVMTDDTQSLHSRSRAVSTSSGSLAECVATSPSPPPRAASFARLGKGTQSFRRATSMRVGNAANDVGGAWLSHLATEESGGMDVHPVSLVVADGGISVDDGPSLKQVATATVAALRGAQQWLAEVPSCLRQNGPVFGKVSPRRVPIAQRAEGEQQSPKRASHFIPTTVVAFNSSSSRLVPLKQLEKPRGTAKPTPCRPHRCDKALTVSPRHPVPPPPRTARLIAFSPLA